MANSPIASPEPPSARHGRRKARVLLLLVLLTLLAVCFVFSLFTRGAVSHLPFFNGRSSVSAAPSSLVDLRPWQTAQTLAALAVTSEENEYARQAEHLADHEVDQAFAAALRQAGLDAQHRTLTGPALALKQKLAQFQQLQKQDQALVARLTAKAGAPAAKEKGAATPSAVSDDLQVAKARLGLDNDQIADTQRDLERASGDPSVRIQEELTAHEESMRKYDSQVATGEAAVVSVARNHTLATRIKAWLSQRQRYGMIEQARQQALGDASLITAQHNALEAKVGAAASAGASGAAQLASLNDRSTERQILSLDDDRIQTEQQLAVVYSNWSAQVLLQHDIVLHLILRSLMLILLILIGMLLCDALVSHLMNRPGLDHREVRTLHSVLELGIQVLGIGLILLVIFGAPQQTSTILGLSTAALTIALQDYIVAFFGWFTIIGKNGIHVGDWVEINGIGGVVAEIRLMTTTLIETGGLADEGHPTGRHITFMNSFAVRGQYFNFSTTGQWMWDEIIASMPASADIYAVAQRVEAAVREETRENIRLAEEEWEHQVRKGGLHHLKADPVVILRPTSSPIDLGSGIELQVRYVTSAIERFDLRNRIYQRVVDVLREQDAPNPSQRALETK